MHPKVEEVKLSKEDEERLERFIKFIQKHTGAVIDISPFFSEEEKRGKIEPKEIFNRIADFYLGSYVTHGSYTNMFKALLQNLDKKARRILSVGSGPGYMEVFLAKEFPDKELIGTDISREILRKAKEVKNLEKAKNVRFLENDARKLNFKKNEFDLVYSMDVLHWLKDDWKRAIDEMVRVLKPGGILIVSYNPDHPMYKLDWKKVINRLTKKKRLKLENVSLIETEHPLYKTRTIKTMIVCRKLKKGI